MKMSKEISEKIDRINEVNAEQNVHLERLSILTEQNTRSLEEHMARTAANERRVLQVEESLIQTNKNISNHLSFIKGAIWVCGSAVSAFMMAQRFGLL